MSSTDVLIYVDVISNKQSIFSSQIRTPSFSINWPSLVFTAQSPVILWRLWSHKPSHKQDSNKYQSKTFVICDHKSDETRSVTHENKAYLVWLMFRMLSNQHYPQSEAAFVGERSFSKSWGLRASGSFVPLPLPSHSLFFCSCPSFLDEPREETLATQATRLVTIYLLISALNNRVVLFFLGKLFHKSTRKCFFLCLHSQGWENSWPLCKPSTASWVCITVSNSPNPSCVYIRLCKHRKRFLLLKWFLYKLCRIALSSNIEN